MKSENEIRQRLEKLRLRYTRQYIAKTQKKIPLNCKFNHEHSPIPREKSLPTEWELAPRVSTTLVVIQPDKPIRLCIYGAENPKDWPGNICDDEETAKKCQFFQAKVSESEAKREIEDLLLNDDFVYSEYKDMAALQWVLNDRVGKIPMSSWQCFVIWLDSLIRRIKHKKLPEKSEVMEISGDLWK